MKTLFAIVILSLMSPVFAGVAAYSGTSGQKLFIEDGGKDAYFIKFTGLKSPWEDKVIKTTRTGRQDNYRYGFEYKEELSSGVKVKSYNIVVDGRATLVAGTIVPQVILYTQETGNDGVTLSWDKALTESSQTLNLAAEHKKKPFSPEVE